MISDYDRLMNLFDLVFPKICVGCQGEGQWLCQMCYRSLMVSQAPSCADCNRLTNDGHYCHLHARQHATVGLIRVGSFHNIVLREAIHGLKYDGIKELAQPLAALLAARLEQYPFLREAVVVPIPLHTAREQERGFNQAMLIANSLAQPVVTDLLVRYRKRPPQARLDRRSRLRNMEGVFAARVHCLDRIKGKIVLLIDDVATTGTTLDAAAKVLKKAGVRSIWAAVIAHDELKPSSSGSGNEHTHLGVQLSGS